MTYRVPLTVLATIVCITHLALWPRVRATYLDPFARMAYVLSVVGLIAAATHRARVPSPVRFLSEASYTIYLYHTLFITAASPLASGFAAPVRTASLTSVGLLGGAAVAYLGHRALGDRSRLVLGA